MEQALKDLYKKLGELFDKYCEIKKIVQATVKINIGGNWISNGNFGIIVPSFDWGNFDKIDSVEIDVIAAFEFFNVWTASFVNSFPTSDPPANNDLQKIGVREETEQYANAFLNQIDGIGFGALQLTAAVTDALNQAKLGMLQLKNGDSSEIQIEEMPSVFGEEDALNDLGEITLANPDNSTDITDLQDAINLMYGDFLVTLIAFRDSFAATDPPVSDIVRMKLTSTLGVYVNGISKLIQGRKFPRNMLTAIIKETLDDILLAIISFGQSVSKEILIEQFDDIFIGDGFINPICEIKLENPNSDAEITALEEKLNVIKTGMLTAMFAYRDTFSAN